MPTVFTTGTTVPSVTTWLEVALTVGTALTFILNVIGEPVQPFAVGVTVIAAVAFVFELFVVVKAAISPDPEAANPIEAFVFVQL